MRITFNIAQVKREDAERLMDKLSGWGFICLPAGIDNGVVLVDAYKNNPDVVDAALAIDRIRGAGGIFIAQSGDLLPVDDPPLT